MAISANALILAVPEEFILPAVGQRFHDDTIAAAGHVTEKSRLAGNRKDIFQFHIGHCFN